MNIKRRLVISNILMVVIPFALSLAVFWCGIYVVGSVSGLRARMNPDKPKEHMLALEQMRAMASRWSSGNTGDSEIERETARFNAQHRELRFRLLVYRDGRPLTRQTIWEISPMWHEALSRRESVSLESRILVDVERAGDLAVVLTDTNFHRRGELGFREIVNIGLTLSVVCSLLIVFVTNRFLTQFVFRHITRALDTLTAGVGRIRDGDLDARINYQENDEFTRVCGDFNDMAERLLDSVNERERNESSRRELIAGISHDLRTPLTSIKAYVEGIQKGVAASPEARERYINTIGSKAQELERIIDKLFLFSKLDIGVFPYHMERVCLGDALSEITDELAEEYAAKGLDVSLDAPGERLFANIDSTQFRNVVVNILENSAKYRVRERASMRISLTRQGGRGAITFADDGPGVADEALPHLLDIFFRADQSRSNADGGSGLGLAIAAKIVGHFGGEIGLENAPGGGLVVGISLPLSEP